MSGFRNVYKNITDKFVSLRQYTHQLIFFMLFSCIVYFPLMSNRLVNQYDGLWEYSYYKAGKWELSLGRWFWLYLDRLRFNISEDPLTSLITLLCYCIGLVLILDIFGLQKKKTGYIAGALFLSNTAVSISLSYRYMSPTFGMAFLWNVLGAWLLIKFEKIWYLAVPVSAICISFGMGCYQANIGCACLLFLSFLMYTIAHDSYSIRQIVKLTAKIAAALFLGALLYILLMKAHLSVFEVDLSSYNGASSYSILNTVKKLPTSLYNAYFLFGFYYKNQYFKTNLLSGRFVYLIPYVLLALLMLTEESRLIKKNYLRALLFVLCAGLIPVACGTVLFIATDTSTSLQMTAPWALALPVLICLLATFDKLQTMFTAKWLMRLNTVVLLIVLYGCIYQVQVDQNAMLEGQIATKTIATEILDKLEDDDLLSATKTYCFVGLPAANPLFTTTDMYRMANTYAKFGAWWTDPACTRRSYESTFKHLIGVNINICSPDEYRRLLAAEEVQNMPIFPDEGCITVIDDIVVVRVSQ
ncbi:MAG: glucosyltransferase domain-containing protein [Lachnospiraceae bacterium]|nr:glucosyltransferase domain-containing protein [Lachnospiraceae bacterium]